MGHLVYLELESVILPQSDGSCPGCLSPLGPGSGSPGAISAWAPPEDFPVWLPGPHLPAQLRRGSHLAGCGRREDQKEDPAIFKSQPGLGSGPCGWGLWAGWRPGLYGRGGSSAGVL